MTTELRTFGLWPRWLVNNPDPKEKYGATRAEFRLEVYNLFNNVNYGNPNGQFGSANFGRITSAGNMRQMQLGVKLLF